MHRLVLTRQVVRPMITEIIKSVAIAKERPNFTVGGSNIPPTVYTKM